MVLWSISQVFKFTPFWTRVIKWLAWGHTFVEELPVHRFFSCVLLPPTLVNQGWRHTIQNRPGRKLTQPMCLTHRGARDRMGLVGETVVKGAGSEWLGPSQWPQSKSFCLWTGLVHYKVQGWCGYYPTLRHISPTLVGQLTISELGSFWKSQAKINSFKRKDAQMLGDFEPLHNGLCLGFCYQLSDWMRPFMEGSQL
jgi:hypothetical protein